MFFTPAAQPGRLRSVSQRQTHLVQCVAVKASRQPPDRRLRRQEPLWEQSVGVCQGIPGCEAGATALTDRYEPGHTRQPRSPGMVLTAIPVSG